MVVAVITVSAAGFLGYHPPWKYCASHSHQGVFTSGSGSIKTSAGSDICAATATGTIKKNTLLLMYRLRQSLTLCTAYDISNPSQSAAWRMKEGRCSAPAPVVSYFESTVELFTKYALAIASIFRWVNPSGSETGMFTSQKMNAGMWMFRWLVCQAGCLVAEGAALAYKFLATILVVVFFSAIVHASRSGLCVNPTRVLNDGVVRFGCSFKRFESFKRVILMRRRKIVFKKLTCIHLLAAVTSTIIALPCARGHGVEVRQCRTPSGNIRFFVEHWHGALSSTTAAGTMDIRFDNVSAGTSDITTRYPEGLFNNKDIYLTSQASGWGCIGDSTPTRVGSTCHSSTGKSKFHFLFQTGILYLPNVILWSYHLSYMINRK